MNIPNDPYMLLSFINMKLRDFYSDPDDMCKSLGISKDELFDKLSEIGYSYNPKTNQFSTAK